MNLCILSGEVINEIDFKFVYNPLKKSLSQKHISIVPILLQLENNQKIWLKAYNEMADFIYQKVNQGQYILVEGRVKADYIEVDYCKII